MTSKRKALLLVAVFSILLALGCGGGGGSSTPPSPPPPPPPPPLSITTMSLPIALQGAAYNQTLQATGGTPPYTWAVGDGTLPPGITLSSSGVVSGTTTYDQTEADFSFNATVSDAKSQTARGHITFHAVGKLVITTSSVPNGNVATQYDVNIFAVAGTPSYTFSVSQGTIPPGLTLSSLGHLGGMPTMPGNFSFTVQVVDTGNPQQSASVALAMTITNNPVITTGTLPTGVQNRPYSAQLAATAGTPPYSWALAAGSVPLPAGLTVSTSGVVSGTPTVSGGQDVTFQVSDSATPPGTSSSLVHISINPPLSVRLSTNNDAVTTQNFVGSVQALGGAAPYFLTLDSGALPPGMTLQTGSSGGFFLITGAPTSAGTATFTVTVTDGESPPASVTQTLTLRAVELLVLTQPTSVPFAVLGKPYSLQLTASGGLAPMTWFAFLLPPGLAIDPVTGNVSGTPTVPGQYSTSVSLTDSTVPPQTASANVEIGVAAILRVGTSNLPSVKESSQVALQLGLQGGIGPFTWSVSSGALPSGLTMDAAGNITGTPTALGGSTFTVTVNDAGPPAQTAGATLTMNVVAAPGRNDTIANATTLSNGTYTASISPFVDPPGGTANQDVDVYQLTANPGAVVRVETFAQRLSPSSPLDTVVEFVDASGARLQTCSISDFSSVFNSPCMDDDNLNSATTDSLLLLQVPTSATGPQTFYVRVLDWRGDARPDMVYNISVSGAN